MTTTKDNDIDRLFNQRAQRGHPRGSDSVLSVARQMASANQVEPIPTTNGKSRALLITASCVAAAALGFGVAAALEDQQPVTIESDPAATSDIEQQDNADEQASAQDSAPAEGSNDSAAYNDLAGDFVNEDGKLRPLTILGDDYSIELLNSDSYIDDGGFMTDYRPHDEVTAEGDLVHSASYLVEPGQGELNLSTGDGADLAYLLDLEDEDGDSVTTVQIGTVEVMIAESSPIEYTPHEDLLTDDERARLLTMSDDEVTEFVEQRIVEVGGTLNVELDDGLYHEIPGAGAASAIAVDEDGTPVEETEPGGVLEPVDTRWAEWLQPQTIPARVRAAWHVGGVNFRLQDVSSVDELQTIVRLLTPVDEADYLADNPDAVGQANLVAAIEQIVDGVPLTDSVTAESLAEGIQTPASRDDIAQEALGSVVCNWIGRWVDADRAGDAAVATEAINVVNSVSDWPYVAENLADDNLLVGQSQQFAEAMATDGLLHDDENAPVEDYYRYAFGC